MPYPTVSIFMLTYNQEQFISQAIESVLRQKTNFDIQLVIGEDYSSDSTRKICEELALENGSRIKLLPCLGGNIGLIANYMRTIKECDGKYIAICDGDDYWIDDLKLQKQVDFLENNSDYDIVYTAVRKLYDDGSTVDYAYTPAQPRLGFDKLIFDNFIHSVTVLFRNKQSSLTKVPSWIMNFPFGDWQTYLWTVKDGAQIHFMNDITAVYRMSIGVSSGYMKNNSSFIEILISVLEHLYADEDFKHKKEIIAQSVVNKKRDLLTNYNNDKAYRKGFILFWSLFTTNNNKYQLIKLYLYSLKKSYISNIRI